MPTYPNALMKSCRVAIYVVIDFIVIKRAPNLVEARGLYAKIAFLREPLNYLNLISTHDNEKLCIHRL